MKERNITIDGFRMIAAILIIFIHTSMIKIDGYIAYNIPLYVIANTISRYCVPIYMMITGYFYYSNPTIILRKRIIKKLFLLWGVWMLIYMPVGLRSINNFSTVSMIKFLVKQLFFSSSFFWGSWYLTATIFGIVFVDFMRKRQNGMIMCLIISIMLSIIDSFSSYYYFLFRPYSLALGIPGNFSMSIFTGIIWITMAYYIVKFEKRLSYFGKPFYFILGIILTFIEFYIMTKIVPFPDSKYPGALQSPLSLPISVFFVFLFIITHKYYVKKSKVIWMRDLSSLIFFIQFGIIDIINQFMKLGIIYVNIYNYVYIILILTILVAFLVYSLSLKRKFKLLRILY